MSNAFLEHRAKYREEVSRRYGVTPELYDEASRLLAPLAVPFSMRKGEYLQRIGTPAQYVHWLHSGVARTGFITESGNEVTLHFQTDGEPVAAHDDLLRARDAQPALNFVVAETAIHGYRLDWAEVSAVYQRNSQLRDYYLAAAQNSIIEQSRRLYLNASAGPGPPERLPPRVPGAGTAHLAEGGGVLPRHHAAVHVAVAAPGRQQVISCYTSLRFRYSL